MARLKYEHLPRVKQLWAKHGGRQHGPNVETVTMPLENLGAFLNDFLEEFGDKDKNPQAPLTPDANQ
jgi:hypothetical protein